MIYYLLPAYNEENSIDDVLRGIADVVFPDENWHVVVVDDGSSDSTPGKLKSWHEKIPLTVLTHSPNMGLGRAMRTGLTYISGFIDVSDAVVALDADNTQDPKLAVRMRAKQRAENLDVIIASRYCEEDSRDRGREVGLSLFRKILSRGAGLIMSSAFRIKGAKDYSCGFRLYSGKILKKAQAVYGNNLVEEDSFVCMVEILVKLDHIGATVGEVPMVLRYDLKSGPSKIRVFKTIVRYFNFIWKYKILGGLKRY